jgi:ribonuclease HII
MANNIQIAELFSQLVDEKYQATSLSSIFESNKVEVGKDYGKFHIMKVDTDGVGTYDKTTGYSDGSTTISWEDVTPDVDLSGKIIIDYYDNEEALAKAFSLGSADLIQKLVKEVDAIRFAKIATIAKNKKQETLESGTDVIAALRVAINDMDNERVYNDKVLVATPEVLGALEDMDSYKSQKILGNFTQVVKVPHDVFYTAVTVADGKNGKYNYTKAEGAGDINFMIVSQASIIAKTANRVKMIAAEQNQTLDANVFAVRCYGLSAYGLENKTAGIYVSYN